MKRFSQYIIEQNFNTQTTGRVRIDNIIHNAERHKANVEIKNITPEKAQQIMAKAQNTTAKKAVQRREKMPGFRQKVDNLKDLMKKGVKLNVPFVELTASGNIQDGFHRTIESQELGIKKIPFAIIKHRGGK